MEYNIGIGSRVSHEKFGKGVVIQVKSHSLCITFMEHGYREISKEESIEILDEMVPDSDLVSFAEVESSLKKILRRWSDISEETPLAGKWIKGKMILIPGDPGLSQKEIPIETFFHKIVMVRDRLRTLEQRVNASELNDEEKINIQQYITRIYGSLTTFNVLFKNQEDQFVGEKSKD